MTYKVGDKVMYKGKPYVIQSVMEHPHANWKFTIKPQHDPTYQSTITIFNENVDKLQPQTIQQLSIFDLEVTL